MKNSNDKSLNDFFRAARDESAQDGASNELINDREAERLLEIGNMRSFPTNKTIGQQLYERLLSTPLKIGITTMTTTAIIAIGFIAFWPAAQPITTISNSFTANSAHPPSQTYKSYGTNTASVKSLPSTTNTKQPTVPATPTTPSSPIAAADSLHPIELSPDQLAMLGIVLEDNGDISFYTKSESSGEVNKFGLPPSWGVRMNLDKHISDSDISGLHIPKSAPRLVTMPDGAKRLFSFESDTSFTQALGDLKVTTRVHNDLKIAPAGYDSIQNNHNYQHFFLNFYSDSDHADIEKMNIDIDSIAKAAEEATTYYGDIKAYTNGDSDNIKRIENAIHNLGYSDSGIHKIKLTIEEFNDENANSDAEAKISITNATLEQGNKIAKALGKALTATNDSMKSSRSVNSPLNSKKAPGTDGTFSDSSSNVHLTKRIQVSVYSNNNDTSISNLKSLLDQFPHSDSKEVAIELNRNSGPIDVKVDSTLPKGNYSVTFINKEMDPNGVPNIALSPGLNAHIMINDNSIGSIASSSLIGVKIHHPDSGSIHPINSNLNFDSITKELIQKAATVGYKNSDVQVEIADNNSDDIADVSDDEDDDTPGIPPTPPIPPVNLMEDMANSLKLDNLIPIRIVNKKNPAHPNELIFWYEPSAELTNALPKQISSVTQPQPKHLSISVYPNPTSGPATIHFELNGAPRAYFSVHNLLGQKVMNGGMTSGLSGDTKLDLSQLNAGMYLLVTTTDDGEQDVERVIVAK